MSQFCIHISDAQHSHEWGYSPTVGTYTCMKCSERRDYNDSQFFPGIWPTLGDCRRAAAVLAKIGEREWFPHSDYAGEPMMTGEFRDPPEALYDDAAQRPLLVYRVCEYLTQREGGCKQCSRMVEMRGEQCFRGCYMMAEELIAVVNEGLRKPIGIVEQDNAPRAKGTGA